MQEKQVFKPFAEFKGVEFDKMFGDVYQPRGFSVHTFAPALVKEGFVKYHIVNLPLPNNRLCVEIYGRPLHHQNMHLMNIAECQAEYAVKFGFPFSGLEFETIASAYEALRAHLLAQYKEEQVELERLKKEYQMPIAEYMQLPKNQKLLNIWFRQIKDPNIPFEAFAGAPKQIQRFVDLRNNLKWSIKWIAAALQEAAEQFPDA